MSQSNVDVLRKGLEAFSSADLERILEFVDPEFEANVPPELSAEPDTYRGHEGVSEYFRSFWEVMTDIRFQLVRFWDAGDSIVAVVRLTAKGRQTAIPVEQEVAQVWDFREGRAIRARAFGSLPEALTALGLSE